MVKVNKIDLPESEKPKKPKTHKDAHSSSSSIFKRWYANKPLIIALLIIFFPVGLFLMWKFAAWTKKTKWIITGIIALMIMLALIGTYNSAPTITLNNVKDNKISTDDPEFELIGSVSSMKTVEFTINDKPVSLVGDTKFSYKVSLEQGDNTINLVATNDNGETKETVVIHRTTQAEFAARQETKRLEAEKKAQEINNDTEKISQEKAAAEAKAAADAKADTQAQNQTNGVPFYVNNAYFKGDGKYDIVVYSSSRDTLQIYVNDINPVKAKVNEDGWATFKQVELAGLSKLSFAKKVGWFKYYPVNYVIYISVDGQQVKLMDADTAAALQKAAAEAKAAADAKAAAAAQAQHQAYIDSLATTYCSNHTGGRSMYIPQGTSLNVWNNPNKDLITKYPTQSNCVVIMTFFVDTIQSKYLDNIINAKVSTGMNKAEVLASWGWPNNNSNFSSDWGSSGTWMWDTGTCYYGVCPHQQYATFYNGIVESTGNY